MSDLNRLLEVTGQKRRKPAAPRALQRAEKNVGGAMPRSLRAFYAETDGLDLERYGRVQLLSLSEVVEHRAGLGSWGVPSEWRYWPFAWSTATSDRLCVAAHPALDGRLVWVPHDDGPRVMFPDLAHFLDALADCCAAHRPTADDWEFDDDADDDWWELASVPSWYRSHPMTRSASDAAAAQALLAYYLPQLQTDRGDVIASQGIAFACELLPPSRVEPLVALLDVLDDDRHRPLHRLLAIDTDDARAALARYQQALTVLGDRLEAAARTAGHTASVRRDTEGFSPSLELGDGAKRQSFRIDYWYEHRDDPELEARFARFFAERLKR